MGGGGGGSRSYPDPERLSSLLDRAKRDQEQRRAEAEIDDFLAEMLARYNARDAEETRRRLEDIRESLEDVADVQELLFGGSVGKHTYVDGLSDVDALVILDREDIQKKSTAKVLDEFFHTLNNSLLGGNVAAVSRGTMAVTVTFRDGNEIQLLPAFKSGSAVAVPNPTGTGWVTTKPAAFGRLLTQANQRTAGRLVPAIKLTKSLIADLPPGVQMTGYHVEALAVDATRAYKGPLTVRDVVVHLLRHAAVRVLRPMEDITGQSGTLDGDLGEKGSASRRVLSERLGTLATQLQRAGGVREWRQALSSR